MIFFGRGREGGCFFWVGLFFGWGEEGFLGGGFLGGLFFWGEFFFWGGERRGCFFWELFWGVLGCFRVFGGVLGCFGCLGFRVLGF